MTDLDFWQAVYLNMLNLSASNDKAIEAANMALAELQGKKFDKPVEPKPFVCPRCQYKSVEGGAT